MTCLCFVYLCLSTINYSLQDGGNVPEDVETVPENFTHDTIATTEISFFSEIHTDLSSTTEIDLTENFNFSGFNGTTLPEESASATTNFSSTLKEDFLETTESSALLKTTINSNQSIDEVLDNNEHPWWFKDALKDIAHYLRAHKFNEYDRRYNRNGNNVERTNYQYFPKPPLRSLHWEVHRYCEPSFLHCVDYLRKKLRHVGLRRQDDTSVVAQENNWGSNSTNMISQVDTECRRIRKMDDDIAPPFEGPLERYQWRATASYFMCWYTMNEVPDLEHLEEKCDNFAYCLDMSTGPNNEDLRANDSESFACAQYSFCPDPCCPNKHLLTNEVCWNDEKNPCFHENPEGQRECGFNKTKNRNFEDLILNRWNVTCKCSQKGYIWSSLFGICVDVDECADSELNPCKSEGQACLNLPGSVTCVCKWGYTYNENKQKCIVSDTVSQIKLNSKPKEKEKGAKDIWKIIMRAMLRVIGKSSSSKVNSCLSVVLGLRLIILLT